MPGTRARFVLVLAIGWLGAASAGRGQGAAPAGGDGSPRWGTKDRILVHIPYSEFSPKDSNTTYAHSSTLENLGRYSTVPQGDFVTVARLPSGALLTYLELDYCDTALASGGVVLFVNECNFQGGDCNVFETLFSPAGAPGCGLATRDLTLKNYTVDNNSRQITLMAETQAGDETTVFNGVYIGYKLQIAQAPADATFGDVPTTHQYFRAIEALAKSGITGGCGAGNYCPGLSVTRGEMAAFLARALGLHFPN